MVNVTDSVGTWACLSICWAPLWTDWLWVATPDNHDRLCKEDCAVLSLSAETGLCLRLVPDHYGLFYSPYRSRQSNNVRSHLPRWDDAGAVISSHFREAEWNYQRRAQKKQASLHFTCIKYADIAKLCLHIWKVATRTSFSGRVAIRIEFRLWSPLGLTQEGSMVSQMDHDKR